MAKILRRSIEAPGYEPTHFLTLQRRRGQSDVAFARAISKFFLALKRRYPGEFEYLLVKEWRQGVPHAHALLRMKGELSKRKVRDAKKVAGLRVRYAPVRKPVGAANYLFKHTKRGAEGGTDASGIQG
jgi:hypothetical protein